AVEEFCNQEHISTSSIKEFVKELGASSVKKSKNNNPIKTRAEEPTGGKLDPANSASSESSDGGGTEESTKDTQKNTSESKEKSDPKTESTIIRKPKIVVSIGNETGELVTNRIANEGMVWVDLVGDIAEYPASSIQIITVIESV
ncbi:transcriptional repressor KorB C-terminal beta-barrel domain-containing protein, partial [Thiolapillus sp.]